VKICVGLYNVLGTYKQLLEESKGDPQVLALLMLVDVISQLPESGIEIEIKQNSELAEKISELNNLLDNIGVQLEKVVDLLERPV